MPSTLSASTYATHTLLAGSPAAFGSENNRVSRTSSRLWSGNIPELFSASTGVQRPLSASYVPPSTAVHGRPADQLQRAPTIVFAVTAAVLTTVSEWRTP